MRALGTRDNRGKKPENIDLQNKLNDFYNNEFYPLIEKPKFNFLHKTQFNAYIAEHIATSFNNNIKEHFISRFRRFLNIFEPNIPFITDKKDDELIKERKRIYNLVKNSILNDDIEQSCPEEFKKFAFNIRNEYLPSDYDKSFYYDCKKECNISYYLKQTIKMNLNVEKHNNEINEKILNTKDEKKKKEYVTMKKKLFQVIPLRTSNIPSYVSFDKAIINTFFNDKSSKYDKNINEIDIWNRIINMNHKIFKKQYKKNYRLSSLSTDGIGVSLTFKKIGLTKNKCNNDHIKNNDFYLEDLIDRGVNYYNCDELKEIKNSNILITGGAGSIGSVLVLKILEFKPKKIVVLDISEINIYNLKESLTKVFNLKNIKTEIEYKLGSITNEKYIKFLYASQLFDSVF